MFKLCTMCLLLICCLGCSELVLEHPLTEKPQALDKEKFEGAWQFDDGTIEIRFAEDGTGKFAWTEWKDGRFKLSEGEFLLLEYQPHNLYCLRMQNDNGQYEPRWFFGMYRFNNRGELIVWPASVPFFEQAVEEKKLTGTVKKRDDKSTAGVTISNTAEEFLAFLKTANVYAAFTFDEPFILRKVK